MQNFTNRLIHETSPYLRQHAHNPVDWYPWGDEALKAARAQDKPIFLSIGYSACHWCHVMEHESFENPDIGKILNEHFISIKVDREERPDLDQIYMAAVQLLTQQGGWPMSMFLTPGLKPFYGGTYFPPDDRYGRPGFKRLLLTIAEAWRDKRQGIEDQAEQISGHVQTLLHLEPSRPESLSAEILRNAGRTLARAFDERHGGFGVAPKFPHPMEVRLLLRLWKRFGDAQALSMARFTLDSMARGGIYDQLGGGFHRYSTDAHWLVPHFEKMLYDNALLTSAYLEAYQATHQLFFREIVEQTIAYVLREMTSPEGPFYSTQDADSEGEEGKFFVWTPTEIQQVLDREDSQFFCNVFDVTERGNWEGHNILHLSRSYADEAKMLGMTEDELRRRLADCKQKLFMVRSKRVWPGLDDKILTSWNGLMIAALAQAGAVLDRDDCVKAASRAAEYILKHMRSPDGKLLRTAKVGSPAKLNAYLEDYSYFIDALVHLYEASFEPTWIEAALDLSAVMIDQFWDAQDGGFFYTGKDHEQLIARTKDPHDSATPSGNSMAVTALLRLAKLTGRRDLAEKAEQTLQLFRPLLEKSPMAAGQMLLALDFHLGPVDEFAIVGEPDYAETRQVLRLIYRDFRARKVVALKVPSADAVIERLIPLLEGKKSLGTVTTYVCRDFACQAPVVGVEPVKLAIEQR